MRMICNTINEIILCFIFDYISIELTTLKQTHKKLNEPFYRDTQHR